MCFWNSVVLKQLHARLMTLMSRIHIHTYSRCHCCRRRRRCEHDSLMIPLCQIIIIPKKQQPLDLLLFFSKYYSTDNTCYTNSEHSIMWKESIFVVDEIFTFIVVDRSSNRESIIYLFVTTAAATILSLLLLLILIVIRYFFSCYVIVTNTMVLLLSSLNQLRFFGIEFENL